MQVSFEEFQAMSKMYDDIKRKSNKARIMGYSLYTLTPYNRNGEKGTELVYVATHFSMDDMMEYQYAWKDSVLVVLTENYSVDKKRYNLRGNLITDRLESVSGAGLIRTRLVDSESNKDWIPFENMICGLESRPAIVHATIKKPSWWKDTPYISPLDFRVVWTEEL